MANLDSSTLHLKNNKQVIFRTIVAEDAEALIKFRKQIAIESTNTMLYIGMPLLAAEEMAKRLKFQFDDKAILNIGAFDSGKIIGYLNFRLANPEHPWVQHIAQFGMMILKEYWGLGIGTNLLKLQEVHAKSTGVSRIEAMVRTKNERGVKLYEHFGYKIEGTRQHAAKIDGEFQDEYFIAKILENAM